MRRWIAILLLYLALLPAAVAARTVELRSGDHDGFTRLVLYLPEAMEFTLTRPAARLVRMSLPEPDLQFDVTRLWDMIQPGRLIAARDLGNAELELSLGCDCAVTGFIHNGRFLVLDVGNPPPVPGAVRAPDPPARDDFPVLAAVGTTDDARVPRPHAARALTVTAPSAPPAPPADHAEPDIAEEEEAEDMADIAAAPLLPVVPENLGQASTSVLSETLEAELQAAASAGLLSLEGHMSVTTTREPEAGLLSEPDDTSALLAVPGRVSGGYCPPGIASEIAQWAGEAPYAAGLSQRRTAAVDMAGRPVPEAEMDLARFYIAYGQGYEALALLAAREGAEADLLRAMATTLETRPNVPPRVFAECAGLAPWDLIRRQMTHDTSPGFDPDGTVESFKLLPPALQALFQSTILTYLRDNGYRRAFDTLNAYLTRTSAAPRVAEHSDAAEAPLTAVATPAHDMPRALLDRFTTVAAAAAASESDRRLVESFRVEYRNTAQEAAFWTAELRVTLAEARFTEALDMLGEGARHHPGAFGPAYAEAAAYMAEAADDIAFLRLAMSAGAPNSDLPAPPQSAAQAIRDRLALLGF